MLLCGDERGGESMIEEDLDHGEDLPLPRESSVSGGGGGGEGGRRAHVALEERVLGCSGRGGGSAREGLFTAAT